MKKLYFSLSLLVALSLVLAACGTTAPATEAAPAPTNVPPTAAPTNVPPTAAPAPVEPAAPVAVELPTFDTFVKDGTYLTGTVSFVNEGSVGTLLACVEGIDNADLSSKVASVKFAKTITPPTAAPASPQRESYASDYTQLVTGYFVDDAVIWDPTANSNAGAWVQTKMPMWAYFTPDGAGAVYTGSDGDMGEMYLAKQEALEPGMAAVVETTSTFNLAFIFNYTNTPLANQHYDVKVCQVAK